MVQQFGELSGRAGAANVKPAAAPQGALGSPALVAAVALLFALTTSDLSQLVFALAGAIAFALLQSRQVLVPQKTVGKGVVATKKDLPPVRSPQLQPTGLTPTVGKAGQLAVTTIMERAASAGRKEVWQRSVQPVAAPSFSTDVFQAAVEELVQQLRPTEASDRAVRRLAARIRQEIAPVLPEAEVFACAGADFGQGTAFGVAVPEVDIVIAINPVALATRLRQNQDSLDTAKLHKSAIRAVTDRLVAGAAFKFRRSSFRSPEPKVTLLAPASLGIHSVAIPITLSVNSVTPLYNASLIAECGRMAPNARSLILLVKRWAKDRGICHAAKGHLSPYLWTLLTIYFLQVAGLEGGALLPPLEHFRLPHTLEGNAKRSSAKGVIEDSPNSDKEGEATSPAALFKAFLRFYAQDFDIRKEAISIRLGRRAPPHVSLPLHIAVSADGVSSEVGLNIEDPLDRRRNLGDCTTAWSLGRLREEFARAHSFCSQPEPSLERLLEHWAPPADEEATAEAEASR